MRKPLIAALAAMGMVALLGPAAAQESDTPPDPLEPIPRDQLSVTIPIDDGTYRGTVGLGGSFWITERQVTMVWEGSGSGPLQFVVSDGELDGSWSMTGEADIAAHGLPFPVAGTNTWTLAGTVRGSDPYLMEGSGSGASTVTAAGRTSSAEYGIPTASAPWQGVMQVCGQVAGNWDQAIEAAMEGGPLQYSIRSYFSAFSADYTTDLDRRIQELVSDATRLQQDMSEESVLLSGRLTVLLAEAEALLGEISVQPEGCPTDPSFMRIITQVVGDIMNTFLARWSEETPDYLQMLGLRRLVEAALRAGAIGPGAVDQHMASYLQGRAERILQRQFDFANAQDPRSEQDFTVVAVTATMLGYTFESGIDGRDICLVFGTC